MTKNRISEIGRDQFLVSETRIEIIKYHMSAEKVENSVMSAKKSFNNADIQ